MCSCGFLGSFLWSVDWARENSGLVCRGSFIMYRHHLIGQPWHSRSSSRQLRRTVVKGNPFSWQNFKRSTRLCHFLGRNNSQRYEYVSIRRLRPIGLWRNIIGKLVTGRSWEEICRWTHEWAKAVNTFVSHGNQKVALAEHDLVARILY